MANTDGEALNLRAGPASTETVVAQLAPDQVVTVIGAPQTVGMTRWQVRESSRELVWAALDCPGAFAVNPNFDRGVTVLGRLAAHIEEVPEPGEELVVVAWPLPGGDERRFFAGTSLFRGNRPLAWARATWFSLREPLPSRE